MLEEEIFWKNLDYDLLKEYNKYYEKIDTRISDYTFNCRYAWDVMFNIKYAIIEGCLVLVSFNNFYNSPFMLMPLGLYDVKKLEIIVKKVKHYFDEKNLILKIKCIDENYLDLFNKISVNHSEIVYSRDNSDYLYEANDLRDLKGRKYSKKRNHLHNFINTYPNYIYESIDVNSINECRNFIELWFEKKNINIDDFNEADFYMIMKILEKWKELEIYGGVIKVGGVIIALTIGSIIEYKNVKTAYIHFEKADSDYEGSYVAINKLFLENELKNVDFVNREEDLGLDGLRFAKESYFPIGLVNKYQMEIY